MSYTSKFVEDSISILGKIDREKIEKMADILRQTRQSGGRLFILGVGGGAGHASHAVCDFRKLAGIEAYSPCDNVSEITARTNDEGWQTTYSEWLSCSKIRGNDTVLVFSVGGGDAERDISMNLVLAIKAAKKAGACVVGIVGRDGGFTAKSADVCVVIPTVNPQTITAQTEAFQAWVWHLLVTHPKVQTSGMKWETTASFQTN